MPNHAPTIECWIIHFEVPAEASMIVSEWFNDGILVDEGEGEFLLYVESAPQHDEWQQRFIELAEVAQIANRIPFEILPVQAEDWVAKTQIKNFCLEIGRFVIYDPFYQGEVPQAHIPICVDAQFSFGAGDHPTTKGCLLALDEITHRDFTPLSMLDIGCGTGILSIAMGKLWHGPILASDIKSTAVDATRENTSLNGLTNRISCIEADGLRHPSFKEYAPYQLVCANVLAPVLVDIAASLDTLIAPSCTIILSGILLHQADQVVAAYALLGFIEHKRFPIGDWVTLSLSR
ncbi:MAG: 50S ribosomal protein L11 methyltransferase [Alphaproteobacteria bacterium]|nr:50S ribosomal protein L11 methyltransferase [Alphaproteobacteria bacterium]